MKYHINETKQENIPVETALLVNLKLQLEKYHYTTRNKYFSPKNNNITVFHYS